ncbi:flagellar hook-associated protein FlgK [bacterium]|nr:flagellar hook-associated protein FlgK [bacterium]
MSTFRTVGTSSSSLASQLKMARDALLAQQQALNTVSHNVANVNTEGYHRQRAIFETRDALPDINGMNGSGVDVQSVERAYHSFLTRQERTESGELGRWTMQNDMLARVEEVMNELGDSGVTTALDEFFNAWEDLANDVDSSSSRVNLVGKAKDLGYALHSSYSRLDNIRTEINMHMQEGGARINDLATRIAGLNEQIYTVVSRKQQPNDLMDQRDQLVKELSSIANITIQEEDNGSVTVFLGNEALVMRNETRMVEWETDRTGTLGKSGGNLVWADTGNELQLASGELKGDYDSRALINDALAKMDTFANTLRDQVNALHEQGVARDGTTGNLFFRDDVDGAQSLIVNSTLETSPEKIAASRTSATGDSGLAHDIYNLQFDELMNNGQSTMSDYYQSIVTTIGTEAGKAATYAESAELSLQQAENWQQQYTGVSLDEEMADMITIQYAFTAASKVANTVNEMMRLISNGFA